MDTSQLQIYLQNLDNQTLQAGNSLKALIEKINNYYSQAENFKTTANSLLNRSAYENDANISASMVSQASAYLSRADACESLAAEMESQAEGLREELRGYRSEYEYYMQEGETNLANLEIAASKLMNMANMKYAGDDIKQTLVQTRQKIVYNNNLIAGCRKRISWIDQICGDTGSQPVKVLKLR